MPMHMQRKAKFHLNKATQESDSIKQNIEFMVMAAQSRKGFNFRCNDDEEQTRTGYSCSKMDQLSFISNAMLGSRAATYFTNSCGEFDYINDIWGYESSISNKKYAIAELWDGTSFVDISGRNPIVVGFLERAGDIEVGDCNRGFWADVKVVGGHAYIGSEQKNSGIQIFDLARLDSLPRPTTPQPLTRGGVPRLEADAFIATIGALHNFIEFPELGQLLAVGYGKRDNTAACSVDDGETVAIFDVSVDPLNPTVDCLNLGTLLNTENRAPYALMNTYPGYVHDGQCFIYNGPDTTYAGVSMCIFFAETEIGIYDMSNREMINTFTYPGATYVHQGWVSTDFATLYANDENDEECRSGQLDHCSGLNDPKALPITRIFDITDLKNIEAPREFINNKAHPSIDHNMYVRGDYIYSANYEAGARVYKIQEDKSLVEVAYFDVSNDCDNIIDCADPYGGVWTHYPYSDMSTTIASNGYYGLHIFRVRLELHENIFE